jgi:subtilisin-like proprotein convertase family protein
MNFQRFILIVICAIIVVASINVQAQEYNTFYSYPNLPIPYEGDPGLWDTINVPIDVIIEDANFYVGITTFNVFAGMYVITVTSPWGQEVTLHYRNSHRILPKWFDTEDEEDGPGDLDDYIGHNAYGDWVMHVYTFAGGFPFTWESWAVEIEGDVVGIDRATLPLQTGLNDAYPNPFNSTTILNYSLASRADVSFMIYDVGGRLVREFENKNLEAGKHKLKWDGTDSNGEPVASGMYFARMVTNEENGSQTFI